MPVAIGILDICQKEHLFNGVSANIISGYGFKCSASPDNTAVLIDDGVKTHICDVLSGNQSIT